MIIAFLFMAFMAWVGYMSWMHSRKPWDPRPSTKSKVVYWLGACVIIGLFAWMVGTSAPSFPTDIRGKWVDARHVSVTITSDAVQWFTARGVPTKRWDCKDFHVGPTQVFFTIKADNRRMGIRPSGVDFGKWDAIEFGVEDDEDTEHLRWVPHSDVLKRW